ncbi:MAG: hypothetical protein V5B38_24285 [Candidatus Accumulibacter propinquus]|jgi:hypothetical protein
MRNVAKDILEVMAPLIEQGKVRVLETSRGVSIEINDSILFSPGQACSAATGQSHAVGGRGARRRRISRSPSRAYRQRPDQEHAVPFELGAFRRARDHRLCACLPMPGLPPSA